MNLTSRSPLFAIALFILLLFAAGLYAALWSSRKSARSSVFSLIKLKSKSKFGSESVIHGDFDDLESSISSDTGKREMANYTAADFDLTEKLDYSSAVASLGYSLIVSLSRTFNVKDEASRIMLAAPILAFATAHILYLNLYQLDYGWNMKVCLVMGISQLLIWTIWAGISRHPSRFKLWAVTFGTGLAILLEVHDFPSYDGYINAHAMWHAATTTLTYLWWSFIRAFQ